MVLLLVCWTFKHWSNPYNTPILCTVPVDTLPLQWHHNECDGISNHQHLNCLLNRLIRRRSKKTSKLHATGLYEGNPLVTGGFPSQMENISIWWCHNATYWCEVIHKYNADCHVIYFLPNVYDINHCDIFDQMASCKMYKKSHPIEMWCLATHVMENQCKLQHWSLR